MTGERILVVDDSKQTCDFVQSFLENNRYVVSTARDGSEGLSLILQDPPDLVILDMQMPQRSGIAVMETLKEKGLDIPIIFSTAHGSEELVVTALRLGAMDYVSKPFQPEDMLAAVERALELGKLRQEHTRLAQELGQARQALQTQLQELNTLYAVGKSVTFLLDSVQVANRVVEAATFMTRAEEGSLMLWDQSDGKLTVRATKSADEKSAHAMHEVIQDELCEQVVKSGKPMLLSGRALRRAAPRHPARALLCVPLKVPGRGVIGVLNLFNKVSDRPFSERDLFLISAISDYASIALENAGLFARLELEKNRLETILWETEAVVIVLDFEDRILFCNRAARRAFNLGDFQVDGLSLPKIIKHQELLDLLARSQGQDQPGRAEIALPDNRILDARISTIGDVGQVVLMQDVTDLKELDRIKSEFVSTVSHDLRTPLTTIQGYLDLLPRVGPLNAQQADFMSRIQNSLSAVTGFIGDLLDVSRIEAGLDLEMVPTHLEPIITEAVAEVRPELEAKRQKLELKMPSRLSTVSGNPRRLRQMMTNLLSNAVKYTPQQGAIAVSVVEGEKHFMICIADTGIGIPLDDQPYIFDKFYRADTPQVSQIEGTGLGLSIVKSVVERHGGRVWVDSLPGQGSTFTVLLPKE